MVRKTRNTTRRRVSSVQEQRITAIDGRNGDKYNICLESRATVDDLCSKIIGVAPVPSSSQIVIFKEGCTLKKGLGLVCDYGVSEVLFLVYPDGGKPPLNYATDPRYLKHIGESSVEENTVVNQAVIPNIDSEEPSQLGGNTIWVPDCCETELAGVGRPCICQCLQCNAYGVAQKRAFFKLELGDAFFPLTYNETLQVPEENNKKTKKTKEPCIFDQQEEQEDQ